MEKTEAKKRIDFLRAEIDRHDRLYYVEARPVIGDRDYDLLYEELLRLERDYPEFYSETSPTQRVSGEPISGFAQVRHEPPLAREKIAEFFVDFDSVQRGHAKARQFGKPVENGVNEPAERWIVREIVAP